METWFSEDLEHVQHMAWQLKMRSVSGINSISKSLAIIDPLYIVRMQPMNLGGKTNEMFFSGNWDLIVLPPRLAAFSPTCKGSIVRDYLWELFWFKEAHIWLNCIISLSFGSFSIFLYDRFMGSVWAGERQGNRCYCGVPKGTQANENMKT